MALEPKILNNFTCSNCKHIISFGPIHSTNNEHICGRCSIPKQETKLYIRNHLLEELALQHKFPCRNSERGCPVNLKPNLLKDHEGLCVFNLHGCPQNTLNNQCDWIGTLKDIQKHYMKEHQNLVISYPINEKPSIKQNYVQYKLFVYSDFVFLLQRKCSVLQGMLWHNVLFLGPPHLASLFTYSIELYNEMNWLIKSKPVQKCGEFAMSESGCIRHRINNIFQEFGQYDDIKFTLRYILKFIFNQRFVQFDQKFLVVGKYVQ